MKLLKSLLALVLALALTVGTSSVAYAAADASGSVGDDGDLWVESEDNDEIDVEIENEEGDLENFDLGLGISGGNAQYDTDDDNSIKTNKASGDGASDNFLNSNLVYVGDDNHDDSAVAEATVGEDGEADAAAEDNDDLWIDVDNEADLENFTMGLGISGLNTQSGTDDDNEIDAGESEASAYALNEVNSQWIYVGSGHTATAKASVGDDTFPGEENDAHAEDNDEVDLEVWNDAWVDSYTIAVAVSGGNSQTGTDDNNSIKSGKSTASADANNFVNSNVLVVDDTNGGAEATAEVGEDGEADATAEDNDEVEVVLDNEADVENVSVAASVSGGNVQADTDDNNSIESGAASGSSCSTNTVNSNWIVFGGDLPEGGNHGCN